MSHRARRRFGQNFLTDGEVIERIAAAVQPRAGQVIVEIGPGKGALTRPLVASGASVHAVEIDRELAATLHRKMGGPGNLFVHQGDALQMDVAAIAGQGPYRLVGNLPYNISTPLLFHLLAQRPRPQDMHFMLQSEVVDRATAAPGGREYGRLSVMLQNLCEADALFAIAPGSFQPAPKVHSTLLRLAPRPVPLASAAPELLDRVVRAAFEKRRKTLRNSLSGLLSDEHFEAAGIAPRLRPEQLSVRQFDALARQLDAS